MAARSQPAFTILNLTLCVPAGVDCVIVKSGRRICGTGAALANAPLVQDKSYFEIKLQCGGILCVCVCVCVCMCDICRAPEWGETSLIV